MRKSRRLVRIRYRQLPDILAKAWITEHGSVVICIRPDLPIETKRAAVRQALREIESNADAKTGPTEVIIPGDPVEAIRDELGESS